MAFGISILIAVTEIKLLSIGTADSAHLFPVALLPPIKWFYKRYVLL